MSYAAIPAMMCSRVDPRQVDRWKRRFLKGGSGDGCPVMGDDILHPVS